MISTNRISEIKTETWATTELWTVVFLLMAYQTVECTSFWQRVNEREREREREKQHHACSYPILSGHADYEGTIITYNVTNKIGPATPRVNSQYIDAEVIDNRNSL